MRYVAYPWRDDVPLRMRLREFAVLQSALERATSDVGDAARRLRRQSPTHRTGRSTGWARDAATSAHETDSAAGATRAPNDRWSVDYLRDTLATSRVIRGFTVVDECTRAALEIVADTSFLARASCRRRMAPRHMRLRRLPRIRMYHGPEFVAEPPARLEHGPWN